MRRTSLTVLVCRSLGFNWRITSECVCCSQILPCLSADATNAQWVFLGSQNLMSSLPVLIPSHFWNLSLLWKRLLDIIQSFILTRNVNVFLAKQNGNTKSLLVSIINIFVLTMAIKRTVYPKMKLLSPILMESWVLINNQRSWGLLNH